MKKLTLDFIGRDNWDRPVYKCNDKLYVDVDPRLSKKPEICTKQNNEFYGEPLEQISNDIEIEFFPFRNGWNF